jgi:hypothetical protein
VELRQYRHVLALADHASPATYNRLKWPSAGATPAAGALGQPKHSACSPKILRTKFALGQNHGKIKSFPRCS